VSVLPDGGFLIADSGNQRLRKMAADGTISTIAGIGTVGDADGIGYTGDGADLRSADLGPVDLDRLTALSGAIIGRDQVERILVQLANVVVWTDRLGGLTKPVQDSLTNPGSRAILRFGSARMSGFLRSLDDAHRSPVSAGQVGPDDALRGPMSTTYASWSESSVPSSRNAGTCLAFERGHNCRLTATWSMLFTPLRR
jgi:hypothetical protein